MDLFLKILSTSFGIHADTGSWIDFLAALWQPFITKESPPAPDVEIHLETSSEGWTVIFEGSSPFDIPDPWRLAEAIRHRILEDAVGREIDHVLLHAGVVSRGEHCLLLVGRSGAGKTTLTLDLTRRGWDLASDDHAPIRRDLSVLPLPTPVGVKQMDQWEELRSLWEVPAWLPAPTTRFLVPASAFSVSSEERLRPTLLVFPEFRSIGGPQVCDLSPAKAVTELSRFVRVLDEKALRTLGDLARTTPATSISYASSESAWNLLEQRVTPSPYPFA